MRNLRSPIFFGGTAIALLITVVVSAAPKESDVPSLFAPTSKAEPNTPRNQQKTQTPRRATRRATPSGLVAEPTPEMTDAFDVSVPAGGDYETAYNAHFAKHHVRPLVVRNRVNKLIRDKRNPHRFDEVIAILHSAMRNSQMQSWMYEALGLALQAQQLEAGQQGEKVDTAEVERTIMSVVDFTNDPAQLLFLASYLERFGMKARALSLYEEIARRYPTRTEANVRGLELARDLDDTAGIEWSTLGIISKAWPKKDVQIREKAIWLAKSTLQRLEKEGQRKEAADFAKKLKNAMVRDVVVKVTWNGDADVDLKVKEPGDTICTYHNKRTTNGGVMLGDMHTELDRSAGKGRSETYVCPEAFAGTYRVLLRHVWGKIPAGKVTVDVYTNYGTASATRRRRQIPVQGGKDALLVFDLNKGRRQDSVEQHQLINAVTEQAAVNRAILASQINMMTDTRARSQQISASRDRPGASRRGPVQRNGGVGLRPEIILLPTGATMSVQAVISADRRYVRITALPFFSGVTSVDTFNINSGPVDETEFFDVDENLNDADADADGDAGADGDGGGGGDGDGDGGGGGGGGGGGDGGGDGDGDGDGDGGGGFGGGGGGGFL